MRNLLGNAAKYMGDTLSPRIEVGARGGGPFVECYVQDNGIGIDPRDHEKIFDIFHRLNDVEVEGTGVGLAIVRKIVDGVGGRLWVESEKGRGATFRFTWPAPPPGSSPSGGDRATAQTGPSGGNDPGAPTSGGVGPGATDQGGAGSGALDDHERPPAGIAAGSSAACAAGS
jgi:hypothetical protein